MREINRIIIHCAASKTDVSAATIKKWHTKPKEEGGNGWSDIGYHYVVRASGMIEVGRPLAKIGAHVRGHNRDSVGICLSGGYNGKIDYTKPQMDSLWTLVNGLYYSLPVGANQVIGHNDLTNAKTCPNFDVFEWWMGSAYGNHVLEPKDD